MATICPVSSARLMKLAGDTRPNSGWRQRTSASAPSRRLCASARLGLVEDFQLAALQRLVQLRFEQQALAGAAAQALAEELQAVAAQLLGALHGHVRLADQRGGVAGVSGSRAMPSEALISSSCSPTIRLRRRVPSTRLASCSSSSGAEAPLQQHGEFVHRQPRDGVGLAHAGAQPRAISRSTSSAISWPRLSLSSWKRSILTSRARLRPPWRTR